MQTEHIDNPKGYGEGEDPRKYDSRLRGVSNAQTLRPHPTDHCIYSLWTYVAVRHIPGANADLLPAPGVGNRFSDRDEELHCQWSDRECVCVPSLTNFAVEDGRWDTSKALVRRTLEECIRRGRAQRANGQKADEYEAYRLLGQAVRIRQRLSSAPLVILPVSQLHTLEDFPAHSNFCELALWSMGYTEVFLHVGDQARIQAPGGKWVAPLVTGTAYSFCFIALRTSWVYFRNIWIKVMHR